MSISKEERRVRQLFCQKRLRDERINAGLCSRCGKDSLYAGTQECKSCLEKGRCRQRNRNNRKTKFGLCATCTRLLDRKGSICKSCLRKSEESRKGKIRWCNCGERPARPNKKRCQQCADADSAAVCRKHRAVRLSAIAKLGNCCACCGEIIPEFLQIDHINGGGSKHIRSFKSGGKYYSWLRDNATNGDFQILCANCNIAKHQHKECPHQPMKRAIITVILASLLSFLEARQ